MERIIGFTTWVWDLFHIGHLNILKNAKSMCDELIVGVTSDERTFREKGKFPIIPYEERVQILEHINFVDRVVLHEHTDEFLHWPTLQFHRVFKGSDWKWSEKRTRLEKEFAPLGVEVIFFPYTKTTSSTLIRGFLTDAFEKLRSDLPNEEH